MIALHVDVQILALPRPLHRIRTEVPFSVQRVYRVPDLLPQDALSRLVAQHRRGELHVHLEHALGRLGRGTRRIDGRVSGILGRSPETLGPARVELRHVLRESQPRVATDLAHLELAAGAPVLALLFPTDRIGQRWTKFG